MSRKRKLNKLEKEIKENRQFLIEYKEFIENSKFSLKIKLQLYEHILTRFNKCFRRNHNETLHLEQLIANLYFELEEYSVAIERYNELICKIEHLKKYNFKILDLKIDIGNSYYSMKDYETSKDFYLKILEEYKDYNLDNKLLYVKNSLGYCYLNLKEYEKCKELMEEQIPILKSILGEDNIETKQIEQNLNKCIMKMG